MTRRVAVVGGGIAGLSAAFDLAEAGCQVTVLESSDRVGGKVRAGEIDGLRIDLGAESILARRPEGLDLMSDIGLTSLEHPLTTSASIWTRGQLRTMPRTVMGVPGDLDALVASGIVAQTPEPRAVPMPDHDVSVASFVAQRMGREVLDRLVEPLLGGVYAGHADRLSLRATAPQIEALGADLVAGAEASIAQPRSDGPVFVAPTGGVGRLPRSIVQAGSFDVQVDTTVRSIQRHGDGWRLVAGPTTDVREIDVDAVVVATPAPAAARLLSEASPAAAFALAGVDYASMAIVTFVIEGRPPVDGSGFLVPPVDGTTIKAATWSTNKWGWSRDEAQGHSIVRTSIGRAGETLLLQSDDLTLIEKATADLRSATSDGLGRVIAARVHRWGGALPQYEVGHLDLVATVEADVAQVRGLEVCGAAYRGVGIPAVIGSGRAAAARLLSEESA